MLRVALTGPESTGKSTLAAQLAAHYGTSYAPEFARDYLAQRGADYRYTLADLEAITHGQLQAEATAEAQAQRLVFADTDLLVLKIWTEHAFGVFPDWLARPLAQPRYDLTLLLGIDLPWEPDPLREHPHQRQYFYDRYLAELRQGPGRFAEIWGPPSERLQRACFLIDELLVP